MRKAILIMILAIVNSSAMAEWDEGYKGILRSVNSVNEITINRPMTWISITNEKCFGLPQIKAMECVFNRYDNPQKIEVDMGINGPISKNVGNLYASKIEKIVDVKARETRQDVKPIFHLNVDIHVRQIAPHYSGERLYEIYHTARLEEDGVSITGRKGSMLIWSWPSLKSVSEVSSIEGEIYRSVDKIIGDMNKLFVEAKEFCIKEKCTTTTRP